MEIKLCVPTDEVAFLLDDAIFHMKKTGVHYCEIRDVDGINVLEMKDEQAIDFYNRLIKNDIHVWAISSPIGKRDFLININDFKTRILKAINMAKIFHTNKIRVFSFFNHNNNVNEVVRRLQLVVDLAKEENIIVCLENEKDSYGETPERINELLDKVNGLYSVYDSSNYIQVGVPSEKSLKEVFHRNYYVHFKDGIHINNDAHITPVGEGEANINKLLNLIEKNTTLSIEHHLRFPVNGEKYDDIKGSQKFVYHDVTEAYYDAVKHVRDELNNANFKEIKEGTFIK